MVDGGGLAKHASGIPATIHIYWYGLCQRKPEEIQSIGDTMLCPVSEVTGKVPKHQIYVAIAGVTKIGPRHQQKHHFILICMDSSGVGCHQKGSEALETDINFYVCLMSEITRRVSND